MASARIRPASIDDVQAILNLEHACFDEPDERFKKRQIRHLILSPTAYVLVIETDGRPRGWAAGLVRKSKSGASGRIYGIGVDPEARGQQLGRRLAEALLAEMKSAGAGAIYLEVRSDNHPARSLYRFLGFRELRDLPAYYGEGRDGLKLKLDHYELPAVQSAGA